MLKDLFKKRQYITVSTTGLNNREEEQKPAIPSGMWEKCPRCGKIVYKSDLDENYRVCNHCNHHFRLSAFERIEFTLDKSSFIEFNKDVIGKNQINFPGYEKKLETSRANAGINEAVITGTGKINDLSTVVCIMDSNFMMGSMGAVVGDKITYAIEYATEHKMPVIIFTTSGGARMQEGIISLMQMAKVSGALAKHADAGLLYITVLTDPTTGGVTASFAMLGDIILSEPGALIGFAGKRVIQNTIKQELPEGFQSAEFLLEKGFIDKIVERKNMRNLLGEILLLHKGRKL